MSYSRTKIVEQAIAWLGMNEADGTHKQIIDIYNSQNPLPVGYKVKYTDAWCATFVSALAVKLGYTAIIPTECSCSRMIALHKKLGIWVENENRVPNPGDILFFDWQDNGAGDNQGDPDHVGIVERVVDNTIHVIEGNYSNSVKRRLIAVNGKCIRGYSVPRYDAETTTSSTATNTKTEKASDVKMTQIERGSTDKKAIRVWQVIVGFTGVDVDGIFGPNTEKATIEFQKKAFPNDKNEWDGIVGNKTWKAGLESV